jgi:hypothetical protein
MKNLLLQGNNIVTSLLINHALKGVVIVIVNSIKCYADACDRIEELENQVVLLKARLDSLEGKNGGIINKEGKSNPSLLGANYDDIILEQNNPNPFAETSIINYYIPSKYNGIAKLILADENGINVYQQYDICNGKPCQTSISAKELKTGIYIYGITINDRLVKSQKIMIIK